MHQRTDKEIQAIEISVDFCQGNNKSHILWECVTKAVFNVFRKKNKKDKKKKEVNKEQGI